MAAVTKTASPSPPPVAPTLRTPAVRLSDRPVVLEGAAASEKDAYTFFDHTTRRVVTVRRDMDVRIQSVDDSPDVQIKFVASNPRRDASSVADAAVALDHNALARATGSAIAAPC